MVAIPQSSAHKDFPAFNAAEMGAIAHLYRGEVYRSTVWRTRLDNTTNWAVAALGLAMSASYSHPDASALPLILIGILIVVFLLFEARRYRYFNVWRARARWLETHFYAPMLRGEDGASKEDWELVLARDYCEPRHHISMARAVGRRLRRTYAWLLLIQALAYLGKIAIHPSAVESFGQFVDRAAIGPVPGAVILLGGLAFYGVWIIFGIVTLRVERQAHGRARSVSMG
ncbi:MAG: DUF2270 domain-containing protein [Hyphomicrobiaceae bacterium]